MTRVKMHYATVWTNAEEKQQRNLTSAPSTWSGDEQPKLVPIRSPKVLIYIRCYDVIVLPSKLLQTVKIACLLQKTF